MPTPCTELKLVQFSRRYLLEALSRCTDSTLDYRPVFEDPTEDFMLYSVREHFLHIADIGEMFVHGAVLGSRKPRGSWRVIYEDHGHFGLSGSWPDTQSVQAELERSWAFQDEHVFSRPQDELAAAVGNRGRTLAEEIGWLVFHESQHRGQILMLMRQAGIEPPRW